MFDPCLCEQVNVGCNNNRPKVAKFLVTSVVTRMKDLTVWFVSCVYGKWT